LAKVEWGYGAAKLVKPAASKKAGTEVVVFLSDIHVPFQDTRAVKAALALVKELQPHRVVLNGDIADFFQLSRFNVSHERIDSLQAEIDEANEFRRAVREAAPDSIICEVDGNHDSRIKTYVAQNARSLVSLRALEPASLFGYKKLGIEWFPGAGFLLRPGFLVKHGDCVRSEAGATAKAELAKAGISGISGHTHRLATYRKSGYGPARQWTEQGCLVRTDPSYITGKPDWCQGVVIGEFSTRTDSFVTHEVPYVDGALRFGREKFRGAA